MESHRSAQTKSPKALRRLSLQSGSRESCCLRNAVIGRSTRRLARPLLPPRSQTRSRKGSSDLDYFIVQHYSTSGTAEGCYRIVDATTQEAANVDKGDVEQQPRVVATNDVWQLTAS
jgi:hypothetical protein